MIIVQHFYAVDIHQFVYPSGYIVTHHGHESLDTVCELLFILFETLV